MLLIDLDSYISPAGMRKLWMTLILLAAILVVYLRYIYTRHKANPFRIKQKMWYSGGLKMSVRIKNISKTIIEINTPEIEFRHPRMKKRRFKIVAPGSRDIFPLGLSPQTSYDFMVEFTRLYEREEILRRYGHVYIWIKDKTGKKITYKKVKIRMPK